MPPPIAMYSKTFVGEPKNLPSTMWLLCGETKMSHAFSSRAPSACAHPADAPHPFVQAVTLDRPVQLRLVRAVANQQKLHLSGRRRR